MKKSSWRTAAALIGICILTGCSSEEGKEWYLQPEGLEPLKVTLIDSEESFAEAAAPAEEEKVPTEAGTLIPEAEATGAEEESVMTVRRAAEVYNCPLEEGSEIGSLKRGESVSAIRPTDSGDWYMIEYNGRVAYIEADVIGMREAGVPTGQTSRGQTTQEPTAPPSSTPGQPTQELTASPSPTPGRPTQEPAASPLPTPGQPTQEPAASPLPTPEQPTQEPAASPSPTPGQPAQEPTASPSPTPGRPAQEPTASPSPTPEQPSESTPEPEQPSEPTPEPEQPSEPTPKPEQPSEPTPEPEQPSEPIPEPEQPAPSSPEQSDAGS